MSSYNYGNPEKANTWEYAASIFAAHESVNSEKTSSLPLVQFWKPNVRFSIPENGDRCADRFFEVCTIIRDIAFDREYDPEFGLATRSASSRAVSILPLLP